MTTTTEPTIDKQIDRILQRVDRLKTADNPDGNPFLPGNLSVAEAKAALETLMQQYAKVTGDTSDGYHTFNELYDYRRAYNAAYFNDMKHNPIWGFGEHKSWKHSDGENCFGGGGFIVMATLPTGQISNHYEAKYWDEFDIPERPLADEWDGHTPQQALERLAALNNNQLGGKL